jgi:hypothetical protein
MSDEDGTVFSPDLGNRFRMSVPIRVRVYHRWLEKPPPGAFVALAAAGENTATDGSGDGWL